MSKFRVLLWIVPLLCLIFIEAIVKAFANLVLAIFYPILKNKFNFYDWCRDWKKYVIADWIVDTWDLSW